MSIQKASSSPHAVVESSECSSNPSSSHGLEKPTGRPGVLRALFELIALQDAILLLYSAVVWGLLYFSTGSEQLAASLRYTYVASASVLFGCYILRGNQALPKRARELLYRLILTSVIVEDYLMLREVLPAIRPDNVDVSLLAIDRWIFGLEPSLWLERFNLAPCVEWFAFFYFSYYFVCLYYLVRAVFGARDPRSTHEFAIGTTIVFCCGQLGYLAVPATGPVSYLEAAFHGPVAGGFFWHCVLRTVAAGSAMKDVFPSLHTAVPTWFVWFASERAKTDRSFRWPRNITVFFALNIVVSTVFLRWHYAIDVLAGLALSTFAGLAAPRLARAENTWRAKQGFSSVW